MNCHKKAQEVSERFRAGNLFLSAPDTDFRDFLQEVEELSRFAPEIIPAIDKDLDIRAKEKKRIRLEDRKFYANQTRELPGMNIEERNLLAEELNLAVGRPRMPVEFPSAYSYETPDDVLQPGVKIWNIPASANIENNASGCGFFQAMSFVVCLVMTISVL